MPTPKRYRFLGSNEVLLELLLYTAYQFEMGSAVESAEVGFCFN